MKNILEVIFRYLGIKKIILFYYAKLQEKKMRICLLTNKAKEKYIKKQFKEKVGYEIDFTKEPKTFNEKIQFRKLYDKNPLYSICADKYRVRKYVKDKIGEEYLIPLLLVTDKLTEEQWDKLPNQFVAKANHNSGPVQIVKDKSKANKKEIIKELNNQLKLDYGVLSLENWYSDIPRKIIVEAYLPKAKSEKTLNDYKAFAFNGTNKIFMSHMTERNKDGKPLKSKFYDENWIPQEFKMGTPQYKEKVLPPKNFGKMVEIVRKLSEDFDLVRVDLYNINGKIYFGELTFADDSGFGKIEPNEWSYKLGDFWNQKNLKK